MPRRDLLARARHRHGRGRPRHPGREPEVGRARPAARRPRRARAALRLEGPHLPEVPRRPPRVGGRRARDARGRDRGDAHPAEPARRARAADRRDLRRRGGRRSTSSTSSRAARIRSRSSRGHSSRTSSTCSRGATRPTSSPSSVRGSCGTGPSGTVRGRTGARRLAVTNAGTIPDRGLFGVFLADGGGRVGELDEEMVYEAREGQTFLLGASTWRIEEITRDRVLVSPAPGVPGVAPFWKGEGIGRPAELGERIGKTARELSALADDAAIERRRGRVRARRARRAQPADVPPRAGGRVPASFPPTARSSSSASATRSATGGSASSRRSAGACTRRGRWRCARVCATRSDLDVAVAVVGRRDRLALPRCGRRRRRSPISLLEPDEIEDLLLGELAQSALYGARFRENAARALLIPRRRPGQRTPLWQQRLKAQSLLQVARRYPQFPIVLETYREVPPGRLRPARAPRHPARDPDALARGRRGRDRVGVARSPRRSSSSTSRRTCTRTTRLPRSDGRRRSPSTATCSAS